MLRPYPLEAIKENWLHDCLVATVIEIHLRIDNGKHPKEWKECIPRKFKKALKGRRAIPKRLKDYAEGLLKLQPAERSLTLEILEEQNQICDLLTCTSDCRNIDSLPEKIRAPAKELFHAGFRALTGLGIRDRQYELAHESLDSGQCPFCGIEFFDSPMIVAEDAGYDDAPREDLDHYLALKHYAFAGCNLNNLVPTCKKCNQSYKHDADVLHDDDGKPRKSFPLYVKREDVRELVAISLDRSVAFGGTKSPLPGWQVDFIPDSEESRTWGTVYKIKTRFMRDVLTHSIFTKWLGYFGEWCHLRDVSCDDQASLDGALNEYLKDLAVMHLTGRDRLRVQVFGMLKHQCNNGDGRLVALLCDYANQRVHDSVDDKESATV